MELVSDNIVPLDGQSKSSSIDCGLNTIDDNNWKIIEEVVNDPNLKWDDDSLINEGEYDGVKRKSKIVFLSYNERLDKLFGRMISDYNKNYSGWDYDVDCLEAIQLTHYFEGDYYSWHQDQFNFPIVRNGRKYNRKISVTVFLNDPEEYEGGEFDLEVRGPNCEEGEERYDTFKLPKKSIIVFPSDKWHRVRPVTSGVRKSLVMWFQGPPFR